MLEESMLVGELPSWRELTFSWEELLLIPRCWKETLLRWRGIYYIFDKSDGMGYVGSAYGEKGLLGRWMNYSKSGHGDNKLLKLRKPDSFHFSILKWSAPDMEDRDIIQRESSWRLKNPFAPFVQAQARTNSPGMVDELIQLCLFWSSTPSRACNVSSATTKGSSQVR